MSANIVLFLMALALTGCMSKEYKAKLTSFETALEAHTGDKYKVVKAESLKQPGFIVVLNITTGIHEAYNISKWDSLTMSTFADFEARALDSDIYLGVDFETYTETHTDTMGTYTGTYTDYFVYKNGQRMYFENSAGVSKDLDLVASLRDGAAQSFVSQRLKSEFSLSSSRADELAKMTVRYQRLENGRSLTEAEKNQFALKALGVSMNQIENAMKKKAQGSEEDLDEVLKIAAKVNNTTPEQVGRFLDDLAGNQ